MTRAPHLGVVRGLSGPGGSQPSTPHQRLYARSLMEQRGLSTLFIVAGHQRYFRLAGLGERALDRRVDAVLEELTRAEITRLCEALRRLDPPPTPPAAPKEAA